MVFKAIASETERRIRPQLTMTTEQLYQLYLQHPVISTDTRKIIPESIFFALKGDKFDANTFAEKAIAAGAAYAVIDNAEFQLGDQYLLVEDVLSTLQELARHHRRQLAIPVIGLTGTNGKTTTKELINAVLAQRFNTYATQGNLNNHIGVPLTILNINATHQAAVIEMGANHQKEIALLCSIAQPSHGMITNVGKAHLEGFGGVEGVKKGKGELYDFFAQQYIEGGASDSADYTKNVVFVNHNDAVLIGMQQQRKLQHVVYYGKNASVENLVIGSIIENAPFLKLQWQNMATGIMHVIQSNITGEYNIDNILAAICIGTYFELTADEINAGIEGYVPQNNRSQIVKTTSNTLICDYYNANPSSMAVAIDNLGKLKAEQKVLILGDMFEMGEDAAAEHQAMLQKALKTDVNRRIFIGHEFYQRGQVLRKSPDAEVKNGETLFFETAEAAIAALKAEPITNSTILIKGSRGMALERLVELL
jgi:UDP-N-acetylmuramoyl-tripeptide--D-alanyl-D-alanine ligase